MDLPFQLETSLEYTISADPAWQAGVLWGEPRTGHLEGPVMYHIADLFANIERQRPPEHERESLRLIALIHDSFKYKVNESRPRIGTNHHAYIARVFATRYISDPSLLDIIELHDDAYHSWRLGYYKGKWQHAEERMHHLIERLGEAFPLYVRFFYADSDTDSKNPEPMAWFEGFLRRNGMPVPAYSRYL